MCVFVYFCVNAVSICVLIHIVQQVGMYIAHSVRRRQMEHLYKCRRHYRINEHRILMYEIPTESKRNYMYIDSWIDVFAVENVDSPLIRNRLLSYIGLACHIINRIFSLIDSFQYLFRLIYHRHLYFCICSPSSHGVRFAFTIERMMLSLLPLL